MKFILFGGWGGDALCALSHRRDACGIVEKRHKKSRFPTGGDFLY